MCYTFHFNVILPYLKDFLHACAYTITLSLICIAFATILGLVFGALHTIKNKALSGVIRVYVDFFRLTPYLVQLLWVYFGFAFILGLRMEAAVAGVVTLSLNGAAYASETFRAGFQSVAKTQLDAALSLGYSRLRAYTRIVVPQGLRVVLPAYVNSVIEILKDTSMFSIIGVTEATGYVRFVASQTFRNFELFSILGLYYLIVTFVIGRIGRVLERKWNCE